MEALEQQLQGLSTEQIRRLLSASGHGDLLETTEKTVEVTEVERSVGKDVVEAKKAEGNEHFRNGEYDAAVRVYTKCIDMDGGKDATYYSNRAMAYLKLEAYEAAIEDCSCALAITPSIKTYMRRANAYIAIQSMDLAVDDLHEALLLEPHNKSCLKALEQVICHSGARPNERRTWLRAVLLSSFRSGWRSLSVKGNPAPPGLNGHALFVCPNDPDQRVHCYGGRAVRDQQAAAYVMDGSDYSWSLTTMAGALPTSRSWHSISVIGDDRLCVYGGVSANGEDPTVHIIQTRRASNGRLIYECHKARTTSPSSPMARSGHSAVTVCSRDNKSPEVYVFGGRTKKGVSAELWRLVLEDDSESVQWSQVALREPTNTPCPRDGHTMVLRQPNDIRGPQLIAFGGNGQLTDDKLGDVWVFDVDTALWSKMQCHGDIPAPRSYHTSHLVDDYMFVVGGRTVETEECSIYVLDIDAQEWFLLPTPEKSSLTPRAWHASVLLAQEKIYVLGGGTFHGPLRDAAVLDLHAFRSCVQQAREKVNE
ncbi:hypothetical protein Poli38472_002596 [Pythium oligandrum]|uniref:Uncharacterized protein n=1 Tax=Pythium oligandrum TaxID=41045 RepID=A0A8K1CI46_PYTOL|nr:hypothetical protein Poli38472_002596 [Pythium oligandrum]|eukprot:TMW63655.1 hypothetical protein Poli38472_002596 [Pythium oligandrum]